MPLHTYTHTKLKLNKERPLANKPVTAEQLSDRFEICPAFLFMAVEALLAATVGREEQQLLLDSL